MKLTAHRGLSSLAPENTLVAFEIAAKHGTKWIEIDVQLSADKVPVVIHDQTVNRCTNGSGKVAELSLQQLRALDAGLWFAEAYRGTLIPTLAETLQLAQQHQLNLNIELKVYQGDSIELLCQQICSVIQALKINHGQLLFSSFSTEALMAMKQRLPNVPRGQLWQKIPEDALTTLEALEAFSVHCDYRFLTEPAAKIIKGAQYQLYCYTPNFPELVALYWGWGVDMMITDVPQHYQPQLATLV